MTMNINYNEFAKQGFGIGISSDMMRTECNLERYSLENAAKEFAKEAFGILPDVMRMEPFVSHKGIVAFRKITVNYKKNKFNDGFTTSFIRLYSSFNSKEFICVYNEHGGLFRGLGNDYRMPDTHGDETYTYIQIPDDVNIFARALAFVMPELSPYIGNVKDEGNWYSADWNDEKISDEYPRSVDVDDQGILAMDDYSFDCFIRTKEEWKDSGIRQLVNIKRDDYDRIMQGYDKLREACASRINNRNNDVTIQSERKAKLSGIRGEKEVDYVLAWLGGNSLFVNDNTVDKFGNPCIKIKNAQFRDEVQEYDHIAIRENGVFVIETKNYGGKIVISDGGNWIHTNRNGETKGLRNPSQQVFRHETLLKSFLPEDIPVVSLICLSNPNLILEGQSNSKVPVLKSDLIAEFIVEYKSEAKLSSKRMREIKALIESYYAD